MTLTLEIPEDLAPRFAAIPESERPRFALAAIRSVVFQDEQIEPAEGEDLDELIAAMKESEEDIAAGRTMTIEEMDARIKAKFSWIKTKSESKAQPV
ncbi:hypothetical protein [Armatimonas sp.]|uniref:hypothetical protein n=1 Tax=Armatimonas sp. TaxID=1872638 RepID=UPI0037512D7C